MSVLVVEQDLDWTGGAIVIGCLLALSAAAYADTWWATRKATPRRDLPFIVRATPADLVVHETCTDKGCSNVVCRCATSDGLACAGTRNPSCWHDDNPGLCDAHPDGACCEIDARSEWGGIR